MKTHPFSQFACYCSTSNRFSFPLYILEVFQECQVSFWFLAFFQNAECFLYGGRKSWKWSHFGKLILWVNIQSDEFHYGIPFLLLFGTSHSYMSLYSVLIHSSFYFLWHPSCDTFCGHLPPHKQPPLWLSCRTYSIPLSSSEHSNPISFSPPWFCFYFH